MMCEKGPLSHPRVLLARTPHEVCKMLQVLCQLQILNFIKQQVYMVRGFLTFSKTQILPTLKILTSIFNCILSHSIHCV